MRRRDVLVRLGAALVLPAFLAACASLPMAGRRPDPLTAGQHMRLAASYEAQGMTEDAARQYDAVLLANDTCVPALIARGNLAFEQGDLKKAERCYRRVLWTDRRHAGANNNLAMVCLAGGKLRKAEALAGRALRQGGPLRPYAMETLASIYMREGRFPEARRLLDEAEASAASEDKALREQLAKTREKLAMIREGGEYE